MAKNKLAVTAVAVAAVTLLSPTAATAVDLSALKGMHFALGGGGGLPASNFKIANENGVLNANKQKQRSLKLYNAEIGKQFGDFRAGLELIYTPNSTINLKPSATSSLTGKLRTTAALFSVSVDIDNPGGLFTNYLSFGFGASRHRISNMKMTFPTGDATWDTAATFANIAPVPTKQRKMLRFAWKVGLGTSLKLQEHVSLNFAYHYLSLGKIPTSYQLTTKSGKTSTQDIIRSLERRYHLFTVQLVFKI